MSAATLVSILLIALVAACSSGGGDSRQTLTLVAQNGRTEKLRVEVADTPEKLTHGLTGRTKLPEDAGMLFVIEQRGPGFWMKDVPIPLSVAFIAECGEIVATADMQPNTFDLHSTDRPYRFGLEVNGGWYQRHGIGVGDSVKIPEMLRRPGCP